MNARMIRFLAVALGVGSLAGVALAQDYEQGRTEDTSYPSARGGHLGQSGRFEDPDLASGPGDMPARGFSRHASAPSRAAEDEDVAETSRMSHVSPGPRFDDESGLRSEHVMAGPDDELARTEMTRLDSQRARAAKRGYGGDELRRIDSEMDRLDDRVAPVREAHAQRGPDFSSDAPMRGHYPRTAAVHHKMAPFSDDPDADREQQSPDRDPRHAYRGVTMSTPAGSSDEPLARVRRSWARRSRARPATSGEEAPHAAGNGSPVELMAVERQLLVAKRKNAAPEQLEALEARAAELRAAWKRDAAGTEAKAGIVTRRVETVHESQEPSESAPAPFWRRGASENDSDEPPAPRYRQMRRASQEDAASDSSYRRPQHL